MPRRRYQLRNQDVSLESTLPLDTTCTVITRQSTLMQGEKNLFSLEKNPEELIELARRFGFDSVQVLDWDMGIGAYKTTIEDRRALHHWLYELLPQGLSKVLLVS